LFKEGRSLVKPGPRRSIASSMGLFQGRGRAGAGARLERSKASQTLTLRSSCSARQGPASNKQAPAPRWPARPGEGGRRPGPRAPSCRTRRTSPPPTSTSATPNIQTSPDRRRESAGPTSPRVKRGVAAIGVAHHHRQPGPDVRDLPGGGGPRPAAPHGETGREIGVPGFQGTSRSAPPLLQRVRSTNQVGPPQLPSTWTVGSHPPNTVSGRAASIANPKGVSSSTVSW